MVADKCRQARCACYHATEPLTVEMTTQHGFVEDDEIGWLPDLHRTPMSEMWRKHLTNRATDPEVFIRHDEDSIVYFTHKVDELAGVAVARIWWSPLAVYLDVNTDAAGRPVIQEAIT